jgi:hypothetical protein
MVRVRFSLICLEGRMAMGFVDCVGTLFVIMGAVKEIRKSEGPQIRESSKVASPHGVLLHTPQRSGKNQSS